MKLKGKVAVITGGNSGIGLATAKDFKAQGARVVIFGRSQRALDVADQTIGNGTLAVQGDVTQLPDLDRLYQQTVERFGKVDILMVNAGIAKPTPIEQVDEAVFDETSNTNFKGAFFTVQRALSHLNDGASIILVTGYNNQKGIPGYSVNSATKAALRSLARTFSAELLHRRIRVNARTYSASLLQVRYVLRVSKSPLFWAHQKIGFLEQKKPAHPNDQIAEQPVSNSSVHLPFSVGLTSR